MFVEYLNVIFKTNTQPYWNAEVHISGFPDNTFLIDSFKTCFKTVNQNAKQLFRNKMSP